MGSPQEAEIFYLLIMVISIIVLFKSAFKGRKPPRSTRSAPESPPQGSRGEEKNSTEIQAPVPMQERMGADVNGIFVVVTTGDPQTQMVAMSLSSQVKSKGKSVQVLLCDSGGDLALRGSAEISFAPLNKSPQALLKALIDNGVTVQVCPFYLPAKGKGPGDLIDGVGPAAPPVIAEAMLEPGIKLFTF